MSKWFHREHHQLAFTFFIVLLLGGMTLQSFDFSESVDMSKAGVISSDRSPASVPSVSSDAIVKSMGGKSDFQVDLNCQDGKLERAQLRSDYLQLHGKACLQFNPGQEVELVNEANGFTASVFFYASQKYQTDLIPLKPGLNKIVVKAPLKNGKIYEYSFEVEAINPQ